MLAGERGVHRLIRISPFDANARRQTAFASFDCVPALEEAEEPEIDPSDLRIDTYRSSGAGGQHVNVTDSAVRITHLPTGVVVSCQNERSQTQNRAKAMQILAARLAERQREEQRKELEELSGDKREVAFGSQIRTYTLAPYQLVKDERTRYETGNVQAVLDGDLDAFIEAYLQWRRSDAIGLIRYWSVTRRPRCVPSFRFHARSHDSIRERHKIYKGDVVALRDVNLEIAKGEFVFLVGPSGSGKSTFLKLLAARRGRDRRAGCSSRAATSAASARGRCRSCAATSAASSRTSSSSPNKTVYENVAFALEVIGRPKHIIRTQVPQILDLVGLSKKADNFPTELSGGEQQRVSIARAFVNRPLILLADEPTGNLDPATTVGIMRLLDRINRTGTTVVMATHDQRIVDAMRRRVHRARPRLARPRPGARRVRRRS